jgi:hypothetical protein
MSDNDRLVDRIRIEMTPEQQQKDVERRNKSAWGYLKDALRDVTSAPGVIPSLIKHRKDIFYDDGKRDDTGKPPSSTR